MLIRNGNSNAATRTYVVFRTFPLHLGTCPRGLLKKLEGASRDSSHAYLAHSPAGHRCRRTGWLIAASSPTLEAPSPTSASPLPPPRLPPALSRSVEHERDPWGWHDGVARESAALPYHGTTPSPTLAVPSLTPATRSPPHLGGHGAPRVRLSLYICCKCMFQLFRTFQRYFLIV